MESRTNIVAIIEGIKKAVETDDAVLAGQITDCLAAKGFNYKQIAEVFERVSGINVDQYDDLMYRSDVFDSQGIKI